MDGTNERPDFATRSGNELRQLLRLHAASDYSGENRLRIRQFDLVGHTSVGLTPQITELAPEVFRLQPERHRRVQCICFGRHRDHLASSSVSNLRRAFSGLNGDTGEWTYGSQNNRFLDRSGGGGEELTLCFQSFSESGKDAFHRVSTFSHSRSGTRWNASLPRCLL